jgi:hypothetical protein
MTVLPRTAGIADMHMNRSRPGRRRPEQQVTSFPHPQDEATGLGGRSVGR